MLCPPPSAVPTNRKQVRFESPLISSYRKITLPSPPPTPLLSPPRSPQTAQQSIPPPPPPPIPRSRHHHNRLVLSRSLPNSPQRKSGIGQQTSSPKGKGGAQQKSLAHRLLQTLFLRPSRSSDSLLLNISTNSPSKSSSKLSTTSMPLSNSRSSGIPISSSLTLISSPSPALCRFWEEERQRQALAKFQLAAQLQQQLFRADYARQFQQQQLNEAELKWLGGAIPSFRRGWPLSLHLAAASSSSHGGCRPASAAGAAAGVNGNGSGCLAQQTAAGPIEGKKWVERRVKARPAAAGQGPVFDQQPTCCQPPQFRHHCYIWEGQTFWHQPYRSIPISHSFPPPSMASSSSAPHHRPNVVQQHSYNELEDFDDDFVPKSSMTARQNRLNSMDSHGGAGERVQIRRMSLKEFSGLDLLEEHNQQKAAAAAAAAANISSPPHLHPWKSGQLPALGSLIDKFSTRRRSSSSGGGLKISPLENHNQQSEDSPYNSFDRAIEGIDQAIRENAGDGQKELEEQRKEARGRRRGSAQLEKQHSGTGTSRGTFGQTLQRLNNIRNHLNSTLQSVPNVSPRKANAFDKEKLLLLNECRILVAECKEMIRSANPSPAVGQSDSQSAAAAAGGQSTPPADCLPLVQTTVDSAERMVESVEVLIRKSNSIFQAQQLTTNADQLLKALADAVKEVEKCQKGPVQPHQPKSTANFEQARLLIRCSTTLAANLISFTELIRGMG